MKWILLIGDKNLKIEQIEQIDFAHNIKKTKQEKNVFVVNYPSDYLIFEHDNNIINDFEEDDKQKLPIKNPNIIMVSYSNQHILLDFLHQIELFPNILIDDDNGFLGNIKQYLQKQNIM